ncbi:hypothetical protein [Hymenobacter sublimis]|uniref:Uncharacterized protein n=1 Tax=Hymenobacter sublimis TaxID=2933777 RepID=A0ABY4JBL4_9BACT|nr:hypothetical protein [Hymenobacter sublimis]UPL50203.1 hypothetical protein MWH26_04665 [Hymenobacter sublimis]
MKKHELISRFIESNKPVKSVDFEYLYDSKVIPIFAKDTNDTLFITCRINQSLLDKVNKINATYKLSLDNSDIRLGFDTTLVITDYYYLIGKTNN